MKFLIDQINRTIGPTSELSTLLADQSPVPNPVNVDRSRSPPKPGRSQPKKSHPTHVPITSKNPPPLLPPFPSQCPPFHKPTRSLSHRDNNTPFSTIERNRVDVSTTLFSPRTRINTDSFYPTNEKVLGIISRKESCACEVCCAVHSSYRDVWSVLSSPETFFRGSSETETRETTTSIVP